MAAERMTDAERAELHEYRMQDLLRRMGEISRDQWASGWNRGLEHDLYLMAFHGAPPDYGMGVIAASKLAEIKRLAELTQAWWVERDNRIALDEAERRFSKPIAEDDSGVVHSLSIPEIKRIYEQATPESWKPETIASFLGLPAKKLYALQSLPVITLYYREDEQDWELRFGNTTIDYVKPAWAKPSLLS
jgi:hypothetical protein